MLSVGIGAASTAGADPTAPASPSPAQAALCGLNADQQRANDRLLNAGPAPGFPLEFGSTTHVQLFDADMVHLFLSLVIVALENTEARLERANPGISVA